jgi:hypothetical protein
MDEHAEAGFAPPLHSRIVLLGCFISLQKGLG